MARTKRKQNHSTHSAQHAKHDSTHHSSGRHQSRHSNGERSRHTGEEMISAGQYQLGRMQKGAKSAFEAFDLFSGPVSRLMGQNWSVLQKMFQAMQEESLRLFNRRLEHTNSVLENSRDFQRVTGLMQLQQEWMLDFARDYSQHTSYLAQRMRDLAAYSAEHLAEASSEALEESESEYGHEQAEVEEKGDRVAA